MDLWDRVDVLEPSLVASVIQYKRTKVRSQPAPALGRDRLGPDLGPLA